MTSRVHLRASKSEVASKHTFAWTLLAAFAAVSTLVTPAHANSRRSAKLTITQIAGPSQQPRSLETQLSVTFWSMVGKGGARKGGERLIYLIEPGNEKASVRLPIGCLEISAKGKVQMKLAHPMDFALTGTLRRVFGIVENVPAQRLLEQSAGDERIRISGLRTSSRVPVTYSCEESESDPTQLIYRVEMVGDKLATSYLSSKVEIEAIEHTLVFDKESLRLLSGKWVRRAVRTGNGISTRMDEVIEFEETAHEEVSKTELDRLNQEFEILEPVAIGTLPGHAEEKLRKLTGTLEKYSKTHAEGELALAVPALTKALNSRLAQIGAPRDPDLKGRKLVGKRAPEFTLKDLTGRDISLADFAGKIVMVTFWGYA